MRSKRNQVLKYESWSCGRRSIITDFSRKYFFSLLFQRCVTLVPAGSVQKFRTRPTCSARNDDGKIGYFKNPVGNSWEISSFEIVKRILVPEVFVFLSFCCFPPFD